MPNIAHDSYSEQLRPSSGPSSRHFCWLSCSRWFDTEVRGCIKGESHLCAAALLSSGLGCSGVTASMLSAQGVASCGSTLDTRQLWQRQHSAAAKGPVLAAVCPHSKQLLPFPHARRLWLPAVRRRASSGTHEPAFKAQAVLRSDKATQQTRRDTEEPD